MRIFIPLLLFLAPSSIRAYGLRYSFICLAASLTNVSSFNSTAIIGDGDLCLGVSPGPGVPPTQPLPLQLKSRQRVIGAGYDLLKASWNLTYADKGTLRFSINQVLCARRKSYKTPEVYLDVGCNTPLAYFNTTKLRSNAEGMGVFQHVDTGMCLTVMKCNLKTLCTTINQVQTCTKYCVRNVYNPASPGGFVRGAYVKLWPCYFGKKGSLGDAPAQTFRSVLDCNEGCNPAMIGDGFCQTACANAQCNLDGGDCSSAAPTTPTLAPTESPTRSPVLRPTFSPTRSPTNSPSESPSESPSHSPTKSPTTVPTRSPTSPTPTTSPTHSPSASPTRAPSLSPSSSPTHTPTRSPTVTPTHFPSHSPTRSPTHSAEPFPWWWILVGLILACICCFGCWLYRRNREDEEKEEEPVIRVVPPPPPVIPVPPLVEEMPVEPVVVPVRASTPITTPVPTPEPEREELAESNVEDAPVPFDPLKLGPNRPRGGVPSTGWGGAKDMSSANLPSKAILRQRSEDFHASSVPELIQKRKRRMFRREDVEQLGVKELKELIVGHGGSVAGCISKEDLIDRAVEMGGVDHS